MLDVTSLETAVDRLADRLRAAPRSRLRQGAAAEGLALARELAVRARRIECPGAEPPIMPEAGLFAVGDQVAVAGHDLAMALRHADAGGSGRRADHADRAADGSGSGSGEAAGERLAEALELVRAAGARCGC
ncbi:hypothetical protein [Streptomyces zingiberis]|uniref:Uncharacterized protein n=1 Tax=Streptomyces zingiberis TaxID=2053010 RepID=A0ABX1C4A7_9ACTN|nr:hypothetical protein [Streptomyces zingiberis]NJQ02752.1 hypothetical protein [Streptomyces zingiberis]